MTDTFASFLATLERLSPGTAVAPRAAEPTADERRAWQVAVVSALDNSAPLDVDQLLKQSKLEVSQVVRALEDLQQMGAVDLSPDAQGKVLFSLSQKLRELLVKQVAATAG